MEHFGRDSLGIEKPTERGGGGEKIEGIKAGRKGEHWGKRENESRNGFQGGLKEKKPALKEGGRTKERNQSQGNKKKGQRAFLETQKRKVLIATKERSKHTGGAPSSRKKSRG